MKFASSVALLACATSTMAFAPKAFQAKTVSNSALFAETGILSKETGKSSLDPAVIERYNALAFPGDVILAEYVWVDAEGNTRSKTRTLPAKKVCAFT